MTRLMQIGPEYGERAYRFCADQAERCTYIAGWIHGGGLTHASTTIKGWLLAETDQAGSLVGLVFISATGVVIPVLRCESAFERILALARANSGMVRVLVGEESVVDSMWRRLEALGLKARISRRQIVYTVDLAHHVSGREDLPLVEATEHDLDEIVTASAAMAREEAHDDPQARNPMMFRDRIRQRLSKRQDFVYRENGRLVFKSNVSALSPVGGQLEGVYTIPSMRRRRLASRGTSAVTRWVLQRSARAVLLVNDDNAPARDMYEQIGYGVSHSSRTIYLAP